MDQAARIQESDSKITRITYERLRFHGKGSEYFKIYIVNLLLTMATLGIYSAWAKVRTKKYLYANTEFQGATFDYHAKPVPILIGRFIAAGLVALNFISAKINPSFANTGFLILMVAMPFFIAKTLRFNAKNTSYKNVRFSHEGSIKTLYGIFLKYLGVPVALNAAATIYMATLGNPATAPESVQATQGIIIMGVFGFNFIYALLLAPRFLNAFYEFVYNNMTFGGLPIKLKGGLKEIKKEVTRPFILRLALAGAGVVGLFILSGMLVKFIPQAAIAAPLFIFLAYLLIIRLSLWMPFLIHNYIWGRLEMDEAKTRTDLEWKSFFGTSLVNMIVTGLTLGLAYPWAKIRITKLKAESRKVRLEELDGIIAQAQEKESAIAEEISDAMDFEFEMGL